MFKEYIIVMENNESTKGRKIISNEELKKFARNYVTEMLEELTGVRKKDDI